MQNNKSVLDGVRVIDFGQYIAGPLAAMILADFGAEVIHVD
ncbi:MAG: CoA transferase, partial [Firmicutes bacterium]|nr:CoA transferase [Bacillota bacterium]